MSSSRSGRTVRSRFRSSLLPVLAVGVSLALGGCFRPLYGPSVNGPNVAEQLASVDVVVIPKTSQERLAHYMEQELRFNLDGSGRQATKAYRLEMDLSQEVLTSSVNQTTGQAVAAILRVKANYKLIEGGSTNVLAEGSASASAGYDRTPQRYSNLRAARDAEIRASKVLAEQMQTKLAAWFASRK